ncbi:FadR/GntR family transcriptional regulator [Pedobacter panaciterrae]
MDLLNSIRKIDTSSLVDRVETKLVELLQAKQLKIGDSIPTELELCSSLGVSRTVVREALLRLRMMGLIDTKKKKGTVITSPDIFGILSKSMNPYILDEETLKEIFEIRLTLEIGMADFLFRNITPKDIKELKAIVENELSNGQRLSF